MARAGPVPGIHPKKSLRSNAAKVIAVRLGEFLSFRGSLDDANRVTELHDMRIAAKRLRYALEMFAVCYANSKALLKDLTQIQEDLGDIHDLDVLGDVLRGRLAALDASLPERATEIMSQDLAPREKRAQLRRVLSAYAREQRRLGLLELLGDKTAERGRRYAAFHERWGAGGLDALAARILEETQDEPKHRESDQEGGLTAAQTPAVGAV
jgi:CHAD domain